MLGRKSPTTRLESLDDIELGVSPSQSWLSGVTSSRPRNAREVTNSDDDEEGSPLIRRSMSCSGPSISERKSSMTLPTIAEEGATTTEYLQAECFGMYLGTSSSMVSNSAVQRMWEGDLLDCLDDPHLAVQTACCPCITFGQNMRIAGFGSIPFQATVYCVATAGLFLTFQAIALYMSSDFFGWLSLVLFFIGTGYGAYHRMEMRRKFNIYGDDTMDYFSHGCCGCCALCQEGRTLQANVSNGVWSGRGSLVTTVGQPQSLTEIPPLSHNMIFKQVGFHSPLDPNEEQTVVEMENPMAVKMESISSSKDS